MQLPHEIEEAFTKIFGFPKKVTFCSVASMQEGNPYVRTMRLYDMDQGCPILLTHTQSAKWKDFEKSKRCALCFVSPDYLTQIIVQGECVLTTSEDDREAASNYYQGVRSDVRDIYCSEYPMNSEYLESDEFRAPESVPSTFGMVRLIPHFWERLNLVPNAYTKSARLHFTRKGQEWEKSRVAVG